MQPPLGLNVRAPRRDVVGFLNLGRVCQPAILNRLRALLQRDAEHWRASAGDL
jgi:hypothetical protein